MKRYDKRWRIERARLRRNWRYYRCTIIIIIYAQESSHAIGTARWRAPNGAPSTTLFFVRAGLSNHFRTRIQRNNDTLRKRLMNGAYKRVFLFSFIACAGDRYLLWGSWVLSCNRSFSPLCTSWKSRLWPSPDSTTTCWTSSRQKDCPAGAWTCRLWPASLPTSARSGTAVIYGAKWKHEYA